jgi:predicted nucleic acid-binding protein
VPPGRQRPALDVEARLKLFDAATARQRRRQETAGQPARGGAAGGPASSSTSVAALVDTNVLVYRFDRRFPDKQRIATDLLRRGLREDTVRLPHQAVVEFVAAVTRPLADGDPLLDPADARREAEEPLAQFVVLYPTEAVVRAAIRGWATYQLGWFDAHLWAYAEVNGLPELWSEDFQHDRLFGTVRALNPFR